MLDLVGFGLLIPLAVLGVIVWFFLRFRSLEIYKKAHAIRVGWQTLKNAQNDHSLSLGRLRNQAERTIKEIREEAIRGLLAREPLGKLDQYPGIGPAAVEKLRRAGCTDISSLEGKRLEDLSGFGPKRAADIRKAVQALRANAISRLDSPSSLEFRALQKETAQIQTKLARDLAQSESDFAWRAQKLLEWEPAFKRAQEVAFFPWLFGQPMPADLPEAFDTQPPPLVETNPASLPRDETPVREKANPSEQVIPEPVVPGVTLPSQTSAKGRTPGEKAYRVPTAENPTARPVEARVPDDPMVLTACLFLAVARANGRLTEGEKIACKRALNELFGGDPRQKQRIATILEECGDSGWTLEEILDQSRKSLSGPLCQKWIREGAKVRDEAKSRSGKEQEVWAKISKALGDTRPQPPELPTDSQGGVGGGQDRVSQETGNGSGDRAKGPLGESSGSGSERLGDPDRLWANRSQSPQRETSPFPEVAREDPSSLRFPTASPTPEALPESPRKVLEILESVPLSPALVRRQWKDLLEKFDPAKFSSHGEEFVAMAKRKREAVERCAKSLLRELGEEPVLQEPEKDLRHNPDLDAAFGL